MDPTLQTMDTSGGIDSAWLSARLGNAIDVSIDRVINKPQMVYDAGQAYGVDSNGNLYQLGQQNGQLARPGVGVGVNKTLLVLGLIAFLIFAEKK